MGHTPINYLPSGEFGLSGCHYPPAHLLTLAQLAGKLTCLFGLAVAEGLARRVQGTSAFLFGWADSPLQRSLAQRRKEMGWFKKSVDLKELRPDVGPPPQKQYGLTGELQLRHNGDTYCVNPIVL